MLKADALRQTVQHYNGVKAPFVLLLGPFGAGKGRFIQDLETLLGSQFELCSTSSVSGRSLRRRLKAFDAPGIDTPAEAVSKLHGSTLGNGMLESRLTRTLVFRDVDLFDEDSLEVLRLVIAAQWVGVIATCSSESNIGSQLSRSVHGDRGLPLKLNALADEEVKGLLEEVLGAPPTSALQSYLQSVTGSLTEDLIVVAVTGRHEGWIATINARSAILRSPIWLDRRGADAFRQEIESILSEGVVELLRQVALAERIPIVNLFADAETRDMVYWCEEAGLLTLRGSHVHLARAWHRHALVLSIGHDGLAEQETSAGILHYRIQSHVPDTDAALFAAGEHLESGLLDQAWFLVSDIPKSDPRVLGIEASVLAVRGAPRTALDTLVQRDSPADFTADVSAVEAFIRSALLSAPSSDNSVLADLSRRLEMLEDFAPEGYLRTFQPPTGPLAPSRHRPQEASDLGQYVVDAQLLADASCAALDAYAAVLAGDGERARSSLAVIMSISAAELPIIATTWILERVGLARVLAFPDEHVLPHEWMVGETAERRLQHAITDQALLALKHIVCGVDSEILRVELDDLWLQFEVGLPLGNVSRRLLEALDFVISGPRSEEIFGPAGISVPSFGRTFSDVCVEVVAILGRLLHVPARDLIPTLYSTADARPLAPGMWRTSMRCLLLRRASLLPAGVLRELVVLARTAGVEPEVVGRVEAYLECGPPAGAEMLAEPIPGHPAFRFCVDRITEHPGAPQLRSDIVELLSDREAHVTVLLADGANAVEVGSELGISVRTVQAHIRSIYRKLGVGSRLQLLARLTGGGGE
ncbi:helix-turn-helix transcriptional regulator [Nesterenkonia salmonea]|nr:helix-turn-helix transcriptional regulator [Nesterenkonia salmonea]